MSKISLRGYNREIDSLIDQGQTDEAIAHCKYILKIFPKHLETYRLLGKAFLENRRYSEASDILFRVLNVVPDDFIAQIGMSIIREDEGNLDAAIWHMERAFEVQPSNNAIQEELKRLYGRRDGVAPTKIRLTRAALVRMYSRGELYPQAIAEAQAALSEDPKRVDIEVLLARVYYLANDRSNAARVSLQLVSKLPFCLEANKILTEVLSDSKPSEELSKYKDKISALDPYSTYISSNAPIAVQVPDNAITVERMDWQPAQLDQQQPEWAQNIGVQLEENEDSSLLDWLKPESSPILRSESGLTSDDFSVESSINELNITEVPLEVPPTNMMEETPKLRSDYDSPPLQQPTEETPVVNAFTEDGMPDWLKAISPSEEETSSTENQIPLSPFNDLDGDDAAFSWLESLAAKQGADEAALTTPADERLDVPPDWIKESFSSEKKDNLISELPSMWVQEDSLAPNPDMEDIKPPYLEEAPEKDGLLEESPPPFPISPFDSEHVEKSIPFNESSPDSLPNATIIPTFPPDLSINAIGISSDLETPPPLYQDRGDVENILPSDGLQNPEDDKEDISSNESLPAWLQDIDVPTQETSNPVDEEQASDEPIPDWIRMLDPESNPQGSESSKESPLPEWLSGLGFEENPPQDEGMMGLRSEENTTGGLPGWLDGILLENGAQLNESTLDMNLIKPSGVEGTSDDNLASPIEPNGSSPFEHNQEIGIDSEDAILEQVIPSETQQNLSEVTIPIDEGGDDPEWLKDLERLNFLDGGQDQPLSNDLPDELTPKEALAKPPFLTPEENPVTSEIPEDIHPTDFIASPVSEVSIQTEEIISGVNHPIDFDIKSLSDLPVDRISMVEGITVPEPLAFQGGDKPVETIQMDLNALYEQARGSLKNNDLFTALEQYSMLIQAGHFLEQTIDDLDAALLNHPVNTNIWEILGDAHFKATHLQEALNAYTKAEELLR